MYTTVDC
ncbi:UNVERIFIED_CONTAM: hypothetical protein GTU68_019462 [Idotea baltica]|nr:hypothetical protein [Idotea baltica]